MNEERRDLVSLQELLKQKELQILPANLQRWIKVLIAKPDNQILWNSLREMFFKNQDRKLVFLGICRENIEAAIADRIVAFIEKNFALEEKNFISLNPRKFKKELGDICLFQEEGKEDLANRHLENLRSKLPLSEGVVLEYKLNPKLEEIFNQARKFAQELGVIDPNQIILRDDFVLFRGKYKDLKAQEKSIILGEMERRSKNRKDTYKSGCGKLYRLLKRI